MLPCGSKASIPRETVLPARVPPVGWILPAASSFPTGFPPMGGGRRFSGSVPCSGVECSGGCRQNSSPSLIAKGCSDVPPPPSSLTWLYHRALSLSLIVLALARGGASLEPGDLLNASYRGEAIAPPPPGTTPTQSLCRSKTAQPACSPGAVTKGQARGWPSVVLPL